jgi:CelD/BcsL family acetyltransferase involved in cellulose biosynthesis
VSDGGVTARVVDADDARWWDFVAAQPAALPFHHPAWGRVLSRSYGYRAFAVVLEDGTGRIVAGLPVLEVGGRFRTRRWLSLPFTDVCPPLGDLDVRGVAALDGLRREAGAAELEIRAEVAGEHVHVRSDAVEHVLALDADPEAVQARFDKANLRNLRKSIRSGVTVERGETRADLAGAFYGLHVQTRRRLGVPVQPRRFFEELWDEMIEPGHGFVLLARAEGRVVAGAVYLHSPGRMTYKFGASDTRAWELRPNNLVMSEAIRLACEDGHAEFDFGRTDLEDEGLRRFKRGFGAEERPLAVSTIAERAPAPGTRRAARALTPALRASPPWVCRAIGAVLYRYAA